MSDFMTAIPKHPKDADAQSAIENAGVPFDRIQAKRPEKVK